MRVALAFACLLAACGARTELRGGSGDASAPDASPGDASNEHVALSCASGLVHLVATESQPDAIAIDHGWLYWHDQLGVLRLKLDGSASPEGVAPAWAYFWPDLSAFVIADGHVYYGSNADEVWRAPLYSSEPSMLIDHVPKPGFSASSQHVYVWSRVTIDTPVWRYDFSGQPAAGGAYLQHAPIEMTFGPVETAYTASDPDVVAIDFTQPTPTIEHLSGLPASDIAISGNDVYFSSNDVTNGARVMHMILPSLKTTPIADTVGAFALAQDATDLYFTDGKNLRVRRIAGKTGAVTDVASVAPDFAPVDLVVDDTCVYWTNAPQTGSAGAIMAAPKH